MTLAWEISASHNFIPLTDKNLSKLVQISAAVPIMLKSPNCVVFDQIVNMTWLIAEDIQQGMKEERFKDHSMLTTQFACIVYHGYHCRSTSI